MVYQNSIYVGVNYPLRKEGQDRAIKKVYELARRHKASPLEDLNLINSQLSKDDPGFEDGFCFGAKEIKAGKFISRVGKYCLRRMLFEQVKDETIQPNNT